MILHLVFQSKNLWNTTPVFQYCWHWPTYFSEKSKAYLVSTSCLEHTTILDRQLAKQQPP